MPISASRKGEGASASGLQRERKRLQNRISQQCFREKQATYIKHLEQFVSNIEGSNGFNDSDAAKKLQLIRENHVLRESLLNMRKKLLSLSAQATFIASTTDNIVSPAQDSNDSPTYPDDDEHATNCAPGPEPTNIPANGVCSTETYDQGHDQQNGHRLDSPRNGESMAQNVNLHLDQPSDSSIVHNSEDAKPPHSTDTDISTFFAAGFLIFSPLRGLLIQKPPNASTKSPLLLLESKIQNSMQQFNLKSFHDTISILPFVGDLSKTEIQQIDNETLSDIVHLALKAMLQGSRVGGYVLVMCPIPVVENVLVWRSNPTSENRNRIEPPFRPTILQQRFPNHHPAIDLLYWNELRDQLILCQEEIEIGMAVYHWKLSSVIEFPEQEVAISSVDLFSYLANPAQYNLKGVIEEGGILIPIADVTARDITEQLKALASSYRLDRFEERKLPTWIAQEYPFLDMTNITTKYPIVSVMQFLSLSEHPGVPGVV